MEKKPNRLLQQLGNLIVPKAQTAAPILISNERMLHDIITCFDKSLARESVGTRLLFDSHFLVILHPTAYDERLAALPVIVDEAVRTFYDHLRQRKRPQDTIVPVASHWYFKFGPGKEYNGRNIGPGDMEVIGALSGNAMGAAAMPAAPPARPINVKTTRKVKNTNVYNTLDTNMTAFSHIDFRESGAFSVKIDFDQFAEPVAPPAPAPVLAPVPTDSAASAQPAPTALPPPAAPVQPAVRAVPASLAAPLALARIDCYLADANVEDTYWMQDREVVLARREPDNEAFPNYIRLDSPYVSNPHARIRYNDTTQAFELASFSRNETRVDEQIVTRSDPATPLWAPLPRQAQILLNGVVTLTFDGLI